MKKSKWISVLIFVCFLGWLISSSIPKYLTVGPEWKKIDRLPLMVEGRVTPFSTFAKQTLIQLRSKTTVPIQNKKLSATEWLVLVITQNPKAESLPAINIDNPDVLDFLGIPPTKNRYFAPQVLMPQRNKVYQTSAQFIKIPKERRSLFHNGIIRLSNQLYLYEQVQNAFIFTSAKTTDSDVDNFYKLRVEVVRDLSKNKDQNSKTIHDFSHLLNSLSQSNTDPAFFSIPPITFYGLKTQWSTFQKSILDLPLGRNSFPSTQFWQKFVSAFSEEDFVSVNGLLTQYQDFLKTQDVPMKKVTGEWLMDSINPFYKGIVIFGVCFFGLLVGFYIQSGYLQTVCLWGLQFGFWFNTIALGFRVWLSGRPPVTSLYTSALFIAWVSVGVGILMEKRFKTQISAIISSAIGFLCLIVAYHLSFSQDTMKLLQAVLNSNFWLSTHVIAITVGYAGTFLAGFLAVFYILTGLYSKKLTPELKKNIYQMTIGAIGFSLLFSFVGTVLGGIWADQSWGRFWGWDPKENGALLIVVWGAIILHAKVGNLIKERGVMVLSVLGNCVTAFSWFGVNMLGIGLHSYGFMDKAFWWLLLFCLIQVAIAILGLIPEKFWKSTSKNFD